MVTKTIIGSALTIILFMGFTPPAFSDDVSEVLELTKTALQTSRKFMVANNITLTKAESEKFWPLYDKYRMEHNKLANQLIRLIRNYAENFEKLSVKQANTMLDDYLSIEENRIKLKKKYVWRFKEVLAPKKVVRYYQIENKLDAMIKMQLAKEIPLVR